MRHTKYFMQGGEKCVFGERSGELRAYVYYNEVNCSPFYGGVLLAG